MSVDMSKQAVSSRLAEVGRRSNLDRSQRLATKIDLSASAVTRRLEQVQELRALCLSLRSRSPEGAP